MKYVSMSCSLAAQRRVAYGIVQLYNQTTFSFTSMWIKWFAETSVVCWGLNPPPSHLPPTFSFSLSLSSTLSSPLHPPQTACIFGCVSWVFINIYIAAWIPQPLINITAIPDFSCKASVWEREREKETFKLVELVLLFFEKKTQWATALGETFGVHLVFGKHRAIPEEACSFYFTKKYDKTILNELKINCPINHPMTVTLLKLISLLESRRGDSDGTAGVKDDSMGDTEWFICCWIVVLLLFRSNKGSSDCKTAQLWQEDLRATRRPHSSSLIIT